MTAIHQNRSLFIDLLQATSEELRIPIVFIEKDYYITIMLNRLSESQYKRKIVFKGGTSLSKAYQLIDRFSEDLDFAVINEGDSGNQVKKLLSDLMKEVTSGFREDEFYPRVSKGSRFRRQAFLYQSQFNEHLFQEYIPISNRIIVEISSFTNPFPYEEVLIEPLVTTFLKRRGLSDYVKKYQLNEFSLNVLSLKQTLCEKLVSLLRCSMDKNPKESISEKIRHFYDLHALLKEDFINDYIASDSFKKDVHMLIEHDKEIFSEPIGWKNMDSINDSILISDFKTIWSLLTDRYETNLTGVAYRKIPSAEDVAISFQRIIKCL